MKTVSYYELMKLRQQGLTLEKIGQIYGVSKECVYLWFSSGRIGGTHRYKKYHNGTNTTLILSKDVKSKIKKKAKKEDKFMYEIINDILEKYFEGFENEMSDM